MLPGRGQVVAYEPRNRADAIGRVTGRQVVRVWPAPQRGDSHPGPRPQRRVGEELVAAHASTGAEADYQNRVRHAQMRIHIVSSYYQPEVSGTAPWVAAMAEELARRGHELSVTTTFPHYPEWDRS